MPGRYQKSRRNNYKRRYPSRLNDKKINTLVEKRMVEIAKKEDKKNLVKYTNSVAFPSNLASAAYTGVSIHQLNQGLDNVDFSSISKNSKSIDYVPLTQFGQNYQTLADALPTPTINSARDIKFNLHQCQAFVSLYNANVEPYQACVALIGIPNANVDTANTSNSGPGQTNRLIPRRSMLTRNNWKFAPSDSGIFAGHFGNCEKDLITQHHVLDRKTVTLPGAGASTEVGDANPKKVVHVKLNKVYKNAKKLLFKYESSGTTASELMDNYNIYLCVTTNMGGSSANIVCQAVGGCKFSIDGSVIPVMQPYTPI